MLGPIFHLSYAPTGGAGRIAALLSEAMSSIGLCSQLVTSSPKSVTDYPGRHPIVALAAILDRYMLGKRDAELISILRSRLSSLGRDLYNDASVVNLHWTAGAISTEAISELLNQGVKVAWTLHDYRPITGACHYLQGCQKFQTGCTACPQVRAIGKRSVEVALDRSSHNLAGKGLALVAPSAGLFAAAKASSLATGNVVQLIPNPADLTGRPALRESSPGGPGSMKLLFVAANVLEERKGLALVLKWWQESRQPGEEISLVGKNSERFTNPELGIRGAGELTLNALQAEYAKASGVVFASSEDNAPGVLVEAAMSALPVISLNSQMTQWLSMDGFPTYGLDEVRGMKQFDEIASGYRSFLAGRQPNAVAREYEKLYTSL